MFNKSAYLTIITAAMIATQAVHGMEESASDDQQEQVSTSIRSLTGVIENASVWMDEYTPEDKFAAVIEVLKTYRDKFKGGSIALPNRAFGIEHCPLNPYYAQVLVIISRFRDNPDERVPVLDLGCGLGHFAALTVLAGAKVDAVDLKPCAEIANRNIYNILKPVFDRDKNTAAKCYKVFAQSIVDSGEPLWTSTKHRVAFCNFVIHFLTEEECLLLAKRIYDNLLPKSVLVASANTPFWNQGLVDYYNQRKGTCACPGMGIYNMTDLKSEARLKHGRVEGIPYVKEVHKLGFDEVKPGKMEPNGSIVNIKGQTWIHSPSNYFMVDELAYLFEKVGFGVVEMYYLGSNGEVVNAEDINIGDQVHACVVMGKL